MKKQTLEVSLDGREEPIRTVIDGRDIRQWEARHEASFLTEDLSYTALTELAATSAIRNAHFRGSFEEFMDLAIDVKEISEEEVRPTKKTRGGGSR